MSIVVEKTDEGPVLRLNQDAMTRMASWGTMQVLYNAATREIWTKPGGGWPVREVVRLGSGVRGVQGPPPGRYNHQAGNVYRLA